ncbi:MAG: M20/M25/M40 family metallo-hydrolase [Planctomycetaceae bacterium]|nr:M20/M25/M40 family metallo-hydrolase [Planctomycetaceae bacterium]
MPEPASPSELSPHEAEIAARLAARRARMESDLAEWVAVPTCSGHEPGLSRLRGLLRARLEALGADLAEIPGDAKPAWIVQPGQPADAPPPVALRAIARNGCGRPVLVTGHIDTVHDAFGAFDRLTRGSDGRAVGPGAIDMKGGLVILTHALEVLAELGVKPAWTVLLNSDEETGSLHSQRAIRAEARACAAAGGIGLAMEPSLPDGSLVLERLGSATFRIECEGRAVHAGRDFAQGVSAVNALAARILDAAKLVDLDAGTVVNIGPLEGGKATNIVADRARGWGNARFRDAAREAELRRGLLAFATAPDAPLPRTRIEYESNRPAKPETPAVRAMAEEVRAIGAALGQRVGFGKSGGVSDGNLMQAEGLPTIDTMGPVGGNLHRTDEYIELDTMTPRAAMLAVLLARQCERAPEKVP